MAQHPHAQETLYHEISGANLDLPDINSEAAVQEYRQSNGERHHARLATQLDALPYLRAVINESLRMRPTSTPLPRVTPKGKPVSVAGINDIPPGTRINTFQWFIHRDETKWDRPNEWEPERWLKKDAKADFSSTKAKDDHGILWPFASGPRVCVGNNLTYYSKSINPHISEHLMSPPPLLPL